MCTRTQVETNYQWRKIFRMSVYISHILRRGVTENKLGENPKIPNSKKKYNLLSDQIQIFLKLRTTCWRQTPSHRHLKGIFPWKMPNKVFFFLFYLYNKVLEKVREGITIFIRNKPSFCSGSCDECHVTIAKQTFN